MFDWEGMVWLAAALGVLIAVPLAIVLRYGLTPVRHMLGMIEIDDTIPRKARAKIALRCGEAKLLGLDEEKAEALLEEITKAAICEAYTEHFGSLYEVKENWPGAKCVIHGDVAVIRPILGIDYGNGHGVEAVNVRVTLVSQVHDFKRAHGTIRASAARAARAARAAQQFEIPNGQPEGGLRPTLNLSKPVERPAPQKPASAGPIASGKTEAERNSGAQRKAAQTEKPLPPGMKPKR